MTQDTQHTPGPWFTLSGGIISTTVGPDWPDHTICNVNVAQDCSKANAALIAAAPELLAGAVEVVEWLDLIKQNYPDMAGLIRGLTSLNKAIAKATKGGA